MAKTKKNSPISPVRAEKRPSERARDDETPLEEESQIEQPAAVPRWLKIAAVALPLLATICAGVWTLTNVLMSQYTALQTTLEKERTQQALASDSAAEKAKEAAQLKLDAEKESTARLQLERVAERDARKDEIQLQLLKTDEQQARKTILDTEIKRQLAELQLKEQADRRAAQIQEDRDFASLIAVVLSTDPKPDMPSDAALASLIRYAKDARHYDVMVSTLTAKFRRLRTLEEAQLCVRLAQAIDPPHFKLLTDMNRVARQRVEERAIQDFWSRYTPHIEEMPPHVFLSQQAGATDIYKSTSPIFQRISHDIKKHLPDALTPAIVRAKMPEITRGYNASEPAVFETYLFLMENSAEAISQYLDEHRHEAVKLDLSGCYLRRPPPATTIANLTTTNLFVSEQ